MVMTEAEAEAEAEAEGLPVPVVLHIAQQVVDDASPMLSYTSRLSRLQRLRETGKGVAEEMDVLIWPAFIAKHVRSEFQTLGGPWSKVPPPDESVLSRMHDYSILRLYMNISGNTVTNPHADRVMMVERILEVAGRDWKWLPIKRELRARRATLIKMRVAEEMYCLGEVMRTFARVSGASGGGISRESVLDAAAEKWGTMEALEAHKENKRRMAEKRRDAKVRRKRNMESLGSSLKDVLGDWTLDQLIGSNPSVGKVFKRYANTPTPKNMAAAAGVASDLANVRVRHIRMVNTWFVALSEGAGDEMDVWRINRVGRTEHALLSVRVMTLINACEHQCGREEGPAPIMSQAVRHFASRLRAVRLMWTGSPDTPIETFPTQAAWVLQPTQQFLDGSLIDGKERTIAELNMLRKRYLDGAALMQEYNALLLPDHVKYISDASMSRALAMSEAPGTSWDILSNAMLSTHIDLCCAILKRLNTHPCMHINEHLLETIAANRCMNREAILQATLDRIAQCVNGA